MKIGKCKKQKEREREEDGKCKKQRERKTENVRNREREEEKYSDRQTEKVKERKRQEKNGTGQDMFKRREWFNEYFHSIVFNKKKTNKQTGEQTANNCL